MRSVIHFTRAEAWHFSEHGLYAFKMLTHAKSRRIQAVTAQGMVRV